MKFIQARERIVIRETDAHTIARLTQELSVSPTVATILAARGLASGDECRTYFRPQVSHLHDPGLFSDMAKAVDRIAAGIAAQEKIAVYGDYDVDGITATAILVRSLKLLGADCTYYLPNRLSEGYGISSIGIEDLASRGITLIISVDCGISAHEAIDLARSKGIDVIVTDHHEPKETLPDAFAVIDPKAPSSNYPDTSLAGVGVALKLAQALARNAGRSEDFWTPFLDLASVGTAADIVPLTGENRIITYFGFQQLTHTHNPGLQALVEQRGLAGKPISTSQVVFLIAPSMNAAGRLGDPRRSAELLLTDDVSLAHVYARELVEANTERRAIDARVQEEAVAWVNDHCNPDNDYAIVAAQENWHCGVIGIVASKIIEKFNRPTILFSLNGDGTARGSGRSISKLHLLSALDECSDLLESYGGHAAAAGMVVKQRNLDAFRARFNEVVKTRLTVEDLAPCVRADAEVKLDEMNSNFLTIARQMEPFGPGNMRPVLLCRNLRHKYAPRIVGDNHLKMTVTDGRITMDAIAFNFGARRSELDASREFSLAFSLDENEWNGRINLQLKVKGIAS
jgi:single-stranded-DNA-specific exonuclease